MKHRRIALALALAAVAGCHPDPAPPVLKLQVQPGARTPQSLTWMAVVGVANGKPFHLEVSPVSSAFADVPWEHAGEVHGVAFGGRANGTAIAQGFASTMLPDEGGTLTLTLGGDLLVDALTPIAPQNPADRPFIVVSNPGVAFVATPTQPATAELTISNTGGVATPPLRTTLVGPSADDYQVSGCTDESLAPSTACKLSVRFQPTSAVAHNRVSALLIDGGAGGMQTVVLAGKPLRDARLTLSSPHSGNLGGVEKDKTGGAEVVTIRNDGETPSSALELSIEGADRDSFKLDAAKCLGSDGKGLVLDPAASCTVAVSFAPTRLAAHKASLVVRSAIGGTATLPLTAEGLIPVVLALVGSGDMGLVDLGASGSVTFKVKNIGTERTGTLTYTIPSPFTYSSRPGNLDECREATQLDPGQECEIMATLSSSDDAGKKMATATISATPGGSLSVPLTAEVARVIEATIAGLPYGDDIVLPGLQTVADIKKTVTLKNVSQTTLSNVKLFNENAGWLHTSIGACSGSLGPGESCTLSVYADAADAHYGESQRLRFSINAAGYHTFHVGAWYSALQTNVAHLQVRNGRDLVITNVGNHQVLQPNIVISDGGYSLASNSCRGSLDPGQSCIVRIVHDPMTWQSGTITVGTAAEGSFSVYLEP